MKKIVGEEFMAERDLPWNAIYQEQTDSSRWYSTNFGVFEEDGKFWKFKYIQGLTELQEDIEPWDEEEEIELIEVELKEVLVKKWVEV